MFGRRVKLKFHVDKPCWACFTDDMAAVLFTQGFPVGRALALASKITDLVRREIEEENLGGNTE